MQGRKGEAQVTCLAFESSLRWTQKSTTSKEDYARETLIAAASRRERAWSWRWRWRRRGRGSEKRMAKETRRARIRAVGRTEQALAA